MFEHGRGAVVIRRRCGQADEVDACGHGRDAKFVIFFRWQIDDDQAIDARFANIDQKLIDAIDINRIVIAHENNGCGLVAFAEIFHQLEGLFHGLAGGQRAKTARLNRRTIGHGVCEGHAQFNDVSARFWQTLYDFQGRVIVRVTRCDEGHKRGAALFLQVGEALVDTCAHSFTPRISATVKISLSPRPHMFMTMRWSFGNFGAIFVTWASACDGSSAGMMPSSLQQS